jgi:hypothetical protein
MSKKLSQIKGWWSGSRCRPCTTSLSTTKNKKHPQTRKRFEQIHHKRGYPDGQKIACGGHNDITLNTFYFG